MILIPVSVGAVIFDLNVVHALSLIIFLTIIGIQARLHALRVQLVPESEWMIKMKALLQPMPHIEKASKFWTELSMAQLNSWASSRLSLLTKANSVTDHNNMDLNIEIDCPIFQVDDGAGAEFMVDLGRAHLRTKKLACVADAMMLPLESDISSVTRSALWAHADDAKNTIRLDGGASVRFDDTMLYSEKKEDAPANTPPRVRLSTPLKNSTLKSLVGGSSIRFDDTQSVKFETISDTLRGAEVFDETVSDTNQLFYDIYEVRFLPVGISLHTENESQTIFGLMDFRAVVYKSILPADHTLCKLKIRCSIEEIALTISDNGALRLARLVAKWASLLSDNAKFPVWPYISSLHPNLAKVVVAVGDIDSSASVDNTNLSSSFDEDEFFDAVENDIYCNEEATALLDEHWISESASAVEKGKRPFRGGGRSRRARSVSDVSSISEFSVRKSRVLELNAENLARLEEQGVPEGDEDVSVSEESFHSAISPSQVLDLEQDLNHDIEDAASNLALLKEKLAESRHSSFSGGTTTREKATQTLRIDIVRAEAELKTLRAAHFDLVVQRRLILSDTDSHSGDSHYLRRLAVRRAATLIDRHKLVKVNGIDHSMTHGIKRDLLELSFGVNRTVLRLQMPENQAVRHDKIDNGIRNELVSELSISIADCTFVLRKREGETMVNGSVTSIESSYWRGCESTGYDLLAGGAHRSIFSNLLQSRFPHVLSSKRIEESLLRCALVTRNASSRHENSYQCTKVRVAIGDIELTPQLAAMATLVSSALALHGEISAVVSKLAQPKVKVEKPGQAIAHHIDVAVRLSSLQIVLFDSDAFAAVVFTELGARVAKVDTNELYKNRSQVDLRLTNLQVISVDNCDSQDAAEIFGKQEMYNSIVRLRIRRQLVPEIDSGGWVCGDSNQKRDLVNADDASRVYNVHVGINLDGFTLHVKLKKIARILDAGRQLKDCLENSHPNVSETERFAANVANAKLICRWRSDIVLTKSSIIIHPTLNEGDISNLSKVIVLLAGATTIQPTARLGTGIRLQTIINELSLIRSPGDEIIVDPVSALFVAEIPKPGPFKKSSIYPQLELPVSSPWNVSAVYKGVPTEAILENVATSLSLAVSIVRASVSPSTMVLLSDASKSFSAIVNSVKGTSDDGEEAREPSPPVKVKIGQSVSILFDGLNITLFREKFKAPHSLCISDRFGSVQIEFVKMSIQKTDLSSTFSFGVARLCVVDYSTRSGVQTLYGGSRLFTKRLDSSISFSTGSELLVISWAKKFSGPHRSDLDINVLIGKIQMLLLPSTVRSIFSFVTDLKAIGKGLKKEKDAEKEHTASSLHQKIRELRRVSFHLQGESMECILASKDVHAHLRDASKDPIGVVTFRSKPAARCSIMISALDEATPMENLFARSDVRMTVEEAFTNFLSKRAKGVSTALSSEIFVSISDFQVLRTFVKRSAVPPYCFDTMDCTEREQRVTNPLKFQLTHHLTSTIFPSPNLNDIGFVMSASHAIHINAEFVDVLLYITPSTSGLGQAFRTTITPIAKLIKNYKTANSEPAKFSTLSHSQQGLKELFLSAPLVCSMRLDGVKITWVPGGASRFTEAPIVKISIRTLTGGAAMSPVLSGLKWVSNENFAGKSMAIKHLIAGGWLHCRLAASYHNRRLVAWEPFIEPWPLEVVWGVDLTLATGIHPLVDERAGAGANESTKDMKVPVTPSFDLRRLLRSRFQSDRVSEKVIDAQLPNLLSLDVDLCYLSLASAAQETIALASVPALALHGAPSLTILPGARPVDWLNRFGYPTDSNNIPTSSFNHPAVVCRVTDSVPLNVNISGALIDNVSGYLLKKGACELRGIAPHWIRNESGLVSYSPGFVIAQLLKYR
jgi:hypothetical protein